MKKTMQKHVLIFTLFTCTGSYVLAPGEEAPVESPEATDAKTKLEEARAARDEAKETLEQELKEHQRLSKNIRGMDPLERQEHLKDSQDRINAARDNLKTTQEELNTSFSAARDAVAREEAAKKEALKIKSRASNPGVSAFSFQPEESQASNKPVETDPVKKAKEAITKLETESRNLSKRVIAEQRLLNEAKESSQTKQTLKDTGRTAEEQQTFLQENITKLANRIEDITKELTTAKENLSTAKQNVADNYANAKNDAVKTKENTQKRRNSLLAEQMKAELAFDRASSAFKQNNKLAVEISDIEKSITKAITPEEKQALETKRAKLAKQISDNTKNLAQATGRLHRAKLAMKGQAAPSSPINY
jgi:hypothetical protein